MEPTAPLSLRAITRDNIWQVMRLQVAEQQREFVAGNAESLAETTVEPTCRPLAIYAGDTPVGFAMYGLDVETGRWWIIRLMIDHRHQGRGFGRAAIHLLLERLRRDHDVSSVVLGCDRENQVARRLYESVGFVDTGAVEDDEMIYRYTFEEPVTGGPTPSGRDDSHA